VTSVTPSLAQGRLCIVLAAVLWSTSGAFGKWLTQPTALGVHEPPLDPLLYAGYAWPVQIAFYRVLFAGLVLLPTVRRIDLGFRPLMLAMAACFALMNATFVSALALGTAANAILLQYTAPMWMFLASVFWLGEPADRRGFVTLCVGLLGIGVIIAGGWRGENLPVILVGLASGVAYAGVLLFLRVLRDLSPRWLTVWSHLCSALVLLPWVIALRPPSAAQLVVLFFFGAGQMALAYWLVARGLRVVSPQEAGAITLLEPLLNPLWAYLVAAEIPPASTYLGGALILGALAWRYRPSSGHASIQR
jgi:DME family drug/metabolite transporter